MEVDLGPGEPWILWRAYAVPWGDPAVGDVNGDGDLEVVFVTSDGVLFCLDAGSGAEEWRIQLTVGILPPSPPSLHDLDGDGIQDIALACYGCILAVNGSGSVLWKVEGIRPTSLDLAVGDMNGDGRPEVAAATAEGLLLLEGSTGARLGLLRSTALGSSVALSSGDVDGDGASEVVVLSPGGSLVIVYGESTSEELRLRVPSGGTPRGLPPRPLLVDLDGDGDLEIVAAVGGAVSGVDVPSGIRWTVETWGQVLPHVSAGDVDGDGSAEVFVQTEIGAWGGCIGELVSIDGSTGEVEWRRRTGCSYWGALLAEADSDGDLELLFHSSYLEGGVLQVLDALTGEEERTLWFGGTLGFAVPADVDGDGRYELLVGSTSLAGRSLVEGIACVETRPAPRGEWEVRLLPSDYVVAGDGVGRLSIEVRPARQADGPLRLLVWEEGSGDARPISEVSGGPDGVSADLELPVGVHRLLLVVLDRAGDVLHRETVYAAVGDAELSIRASPGVLGALVNFSLDLRPLPFSPNPLPAPPEAEHPEAPEAAFLELNLSPVGGSRWRGPRQAYLHNGHLGGSLTVWTQGAGPQRVGVDVESRLGRWIGTEEVSVSGLTAELDLPEVSLGRVNLRLTLAPTGEVEGRWNGTAVVRVNGRFESWFPVSVGEGGLRVERPVDAGFGDVGRLRVEVYVVMEGSSRPAASVDGTTIFLGPWSLILSLALSAAAASALALSRLRPGARPPSGPT